MVALLGARIQGAALASASPRDSTQVLPLLALLALLALPPRASDPVCWESQRANPVRIRWMGGAGRAAPLGRLVPGAAACVCLRGLGRCWEPGNPAISAGISHFIAVTKMRRRGETSDPFRIPSAQATPVVCTHRPPPALYTLDAGTCSSVTLPPPRSRYTPNPAFRFPDPPGSSRVLLGRTGCSLPRSSQGCVPPPSFWLGFLGG
jgi:hypothetical protein